MMHCQAKMMLYRLQVLVCSQTCSLREPSAVVLGSFLKRQVPENKQKSVNATCQPKETKRVGECPKSRRLNLYFSTPSSVQPKDSEHSPLPVSMASAGGHMLTTSSHSLHPHHQIPCCMHGCTRRTTRLQPRPLLLTATFRCGVQRPGHCQAASPKKTTNVPAPDTHCNLPT